ncbi:MAG: hypothetical protein J7K38_03625, partial [Thermoplasmata archaeon]|nr:hypothetical protein [Thermoplasmata archaeon]
LRDAPDLIMCDSFLRGFLKLPVPVWIDRGLKIQECTIIISSLRKINRIRGRIEFVHKLCEKLKATCYINYPPHDKIGMEALKPLGTMIGSARGQLLAFFREDAVRIPEDKCVLLL